MQTKAISSDDTSAQPSRVYSQFAGSTLYTISDMARLYNVTLRALRFYEDRGLIQPARIGHARYYDGAARVRLEMILKGKQLGFTLGAIAAMMPDADDAKDPKPVLTMAPQQVETQITELERKRGDLDAAITELRAAHAMLAASKPRTAP